jgi:hypothetical protein
MKKLLSYIVLIAVVSLQPAQSQVATVSGSLRTSQSMLTLEDGRILINGVEIPQKDLPKSLDLSGINSSFNLTGNSLIEINGTMYQLRNDRVEEVEAGDAAFHDVMVYVNATSDNNQALHIVNRRAPASALFEVADGPYQVVMKNYVGRLNEQANEFEKIRVQMDDVHFEAQDKQLALQLRVQAENTARIAGSFPQIEYEGYLMGVKEKNVLLYDGLVREHELEMNTHRLASEARGASTPAERDKFVNELRSQLNDIFELKQENREDEIKQLDQRLQELTELMNKRSAMQDKIIEKRLKELLGELDW